MLYALAKARKQYNWTGRFIAIHCDLGRMEWKQSLPYCEKLAREVGAEFVVVRHKVDLLDGIRNRRIKMDADGKTDKPHWPSSAARYCTAGWKREPVNKWIRNQFPDNELVVVAMGLRADESDARAKKAQWSIREAATAITKDRHVYDWLPIHHWTLEDVWAEIGYTLDELKALQIKYEYHINMDKLYYAQIMVNEFRAHPAYLFGMERLSCALCVLASKNDLRIGALYNPEIYQELIHDEAETGFTFRADISLREIVEG